MIKVLLVDDHALVRSGVRRLLDDELGIEVIGEANDGELALRLVREARPDVVLMDLDMPGMGGLEATDRVVRASSDTKVIVVTVHTREPYPSQLLGAGAMGYLTKDSGIQEIVKAIKMVHAGQRYVTAEVARHIALHRTESGEQSGFDELSKREMEVTLLIVRGLKTQEISDRLCLSPKTIATYRYRIFDKVGVRTDVELTHMALRHGIIDSGPEDSEH